MHYEYDLWGWYVGEHQTWRERCTTLAPSCTDMPEEPGATRCLWSGNGWIEHPYEKPPILPDLPQHPDPRHITPLALRRRFTLAGPSGRRAAWRHPCAVSRWCRHQPGERP